MAGYSGTPLSKKLGIKLAHRVLLVDPPQAFERAKLPPLPDGVQVTTGLRKKGPFDVIVCFVRSQADLARRFDGCRARLDRDGGLWISWPKKSSGVVTDMTEQRIRDLALPQGLVDNKVCAVDETWSGLRLCIRRKDR